MKNPAQYAKELLSQLANSLLCCFFCICLSTLPSLDLRMAQRRFKSSAKTSGIPLAPIELQHGDFLQSSEVRDAITSAGLVYMNNPKFGPELNLKVLGEQFLPKDWSCRCIRTFTTCCRQPLPTHAQRLQIGTSPSSMFASVPHLQQICFDSLIGTKKVMIQDSDVLAYMKHIEVSVL